jgi:hypothetical protein
MKEERRFGQQALGRISLLDDDRRRDAFKLQLFLAGQLLAGIDDDGQIMPA